MRGLFLAGVFRCCFAEGGRSPQFLPPENPVLWAERSLTSSPCTQGKNLPRQMSEILAPAKLTVVLPFISAVATFTQALAQYNQLTLLRYKDAWY